MNTAKEIVALGIRDPDLFMLLPLIEEGVGPDLISDMTTGIVMPDLAAFTADICASLLVNQTEEFEFDGQRYQLPRNPFQGRRTPVLLVPRDVLRRLPVASDWSDVASAAGEIAAVRQRVNQLIGEIWKTSVAKKEKREIRSKALASKENFEALLDLLHCGAWRSYDLKMDPESVMAWRSAAEIASLHDIKLANPTTVDDAVLVVDALVEHFRALVKEKGLWKWLWTEDRPRTEKSAQMLFFVVADAYCSANDIDVTPEAETGAGPVDFKFSSGYYCRVLVEIKLSSNAKVVDGYTEQTGAYAASQRPVRTYYVVIDVGRMGRKWEALNMIRASLVQQNKEPPVLRLVNGNRQESASKRKR